MFARTARRKRALDRGRESGIGRAPSLRTGQAVLPHPALQWVVLPPRGLTGQGMSLSSGEETLLGQESMGPALMIRTPTASFPLAAEAQQATQPHAHPFVQGDEHESTTVLEVLKPASQGPVQVREDGLQALSVVTPGLGPNRVLELVQALLAGPTFAACEVITQEVKPPSCVASTIRVWTGCRVSPTV